MRVARFLGVVALAGFLCASFATDSRVLTMGRHDNFFMDDISIYDNPANLNVYPNMLLGDLGRYTLDPDLDDTTRFAGLARYNRDPQKPYFGGILSYSLNQSAEAGDQYPMLSIGAVLNRHDDMLDYMIPNSGSYAGTLPEQLGDSLELTMRDPLGKIDLLVGYALKNGGMIGVGGYMAFQKETENDKDIYESSLYKVNLGMNWPLTKTMDLEVSAGGGYMTGIGTITQYDTVGDLPDTLILPASTTQEIVADGDMSYRADVRLFSAMTVLNGDFVPHVGFELRNLAEDTKQVVDVNGGLGLNLNIDRGFFWAGVEGLYESVDSTENTTLERLGGRISFGIERNVVWDWLVWRTGGMKTIMYQKTGEKSGMWIQNPESDASNEDVLGFGIGLNIENRLKVDGIVAEDIFYTFSNLFSGNHHHLMTRISVTYSF
ncbi:MAG: hypothetical protein GF410_11765 [Chitinivibrionales bacterium]|nr:hypothetical protein [Chitinivibrionales bacterium]